MNLGMGGIQHQSLYIFSPARMSGGFARMLLLSKSKVVGGVSPAVVIGGGKLRCPP